MLAIWQRDNSGSGYDLYARPLDSSGVPTAAPFTIQETAGNQQNPALAYGANQRTQLAWQDDREGGWDLYTAVLDRSYQVTHIQYEYDPLYRLTGAVYSGDLSAGYQYEYDVVGNMTAYSETIGAATTNVNRTFNVANQLITSTNGVDNTVYWYDDNGNLAGFQVTGAFEWTEYHYNQRNLLATQSRIVLGTGVVTDVVFIYDGASNRLQQIDYTGSPSRTISYTNDILGLSQVLVSDDGATTTHNLFGLDLISQDDGTVIRFMLADGLSSVRVQMVDSSIETTTTYEPYGNLLAQTGASGTVYGFTGEEHDAVTGLVYLRARYYGPGIYVFTSKDPWAGDAERPSATMNGWNYANANPVNLTDATGRQAGNPNCPVWPNYLELRDLCEIANQDLTTASANDKGAILNARKQVYSNIALGGLTYSMFPGLIDGLTGGGGLSGSPAGKGWAAAMLMHFLDGKGQAFYINGGHMMANGTIFGQDSGMEFFVTDPGIRRAIDRFAPPRFQGDEPEVVIPLLHSFIGEYLPTALCTGSVYVYLQGGGDNRYVITNPSSHSLDPSTGNLLGAEVRPYDGGFWAAFGHVTISAEYYSSGIEPGGIGYRTAYEARYIILDRYEWFAGKSTPIALPGSSGVPYIPHEWAISLETNGHANSFDFQISWTEDGVLDILTDFSGYR